MKGITEGVDEAGEAMFLVLGGLVNGGNKNKTMTAKTILGQ